MISNKKRIRVDYAPLNLAVSVECLSPDSPALQVFNSTNGEYENDREIKGSQFWPQVNAHADDGSWPNQFANSLLVDMYWYVDGVEISQHPDFKGNNGVGNPKYEIDDSGSNYRGAITINMNVPVEKQYSLHFEAVVADTRLGTRTAIVTDPFILSTQDKSEDAYSLDLGDDQVIQYNPFKDKLFLYEYQVAHGKVTASSAAEAAATDENAWKREITVNLYKGTDRMTSGFTLELYRVNYINSFTKLTTADPEVVALTNNKITLDLRVIEKMDFLVKAVITGSTRPDPQIQFSVNRVYQEYNILPTNGTAILPSDVQRYDEIMCESDGNIVVDPASILKINWFTDTAYKTKVAHNEGQTTLFTIAKTGIGNNYTDDWMDIYAEGEIKEYHKVAVDESGNVFTDENGNVLIFN